MSSEGRDAGGNDASLNESVDDIDATAAELTAKGVVFHIPPFNFPDNHAVRIGFFKDPDGNPIELVQPLKGRYPQDK